MSIALIGQECSGRHTVLNELLAMGYDTIRYYTTTPDYGYDNNYHISDKEFCEMIDSEQFLYWEAFETNDGINYIGTKYSDYAGWNKVVIVEDMAKLHTLVSYFPEFKSIYLKVDKHEINNRIMSIYTTKDAIKKVKKRNKKLKARNQGMETLADCIVDNYGRLPYQTAVICKWFDQE